MRSQIDFAKEISNYHKDRWQHLAAGIQKAIKNPNEKSIHKLRIAIKKTRSLFQFYEYCHKSSEAKQTLKHIKKIFGKAGEIRDHTNVLLLCDRFRIDRKIFAEKRHTHKKDKRDLRDLCKAQHKLQKSIGKKNIKHTNVHLWSEYIAKQSANIKTALSGDISAEGYHPLRKKIKALVYNAEISDAEDTITLAELKKMDKLQDKIGEWHDMLMFSRMKEIIAYGIAHHTIYAAIIKEEKRLYKHISDQAKAIMKDKRKKSISGSAADLQ